MSVTVLHAGRRIKVALSSQHMPIHQIVTEAVTQLGLATGSASFLKSYFYRKDSSRGDES